MAFIGQMLGAGQGSGWIADGNIDAALQSGTSTDQLNTAYTQTQAGLNQQQQFLQALQAQNGLQNQSQSLAQIQGVANGTGPNPALAQLNQATGNNVANQAALMAGQRGAGANAGLIARQAAMQGANTQQQAAGQGATMQAQQQLAAMNAAAGISGQQVQNQAQATTGYSQAAQGQQQNLLNAVAARNNAAANIMGAANKANSDIQVQNSKAQQGIFGGLLGGAGSVLAKGGMVGKDGNVVPKYADGGDVLPAPPSESGPRSFAGKFFKGFQEGSNNGQAGSNGLSSDNAMQDGMGKFVSKIANKYVDPVLKNVFHPEATTGVNGAPIQGEAVTTSSPEGEFIQSVGGDAGTGTLANPNADQLTAPMGANAGEAAVDDMAAESTVEGVEAGEAAGAAAAEEEGGASMAELLLVAKGGSIPGRKKIPALVSPGEVYLNPKQAQAVASRKADPIAAGKKVPGKAKVSGNSYANDTVHAKLDAGGIVIPRSVMQSEDPHKEAYKFVDAIMAKHNIKASAAAKKAKK